MNSENIGVNLPSEACAEIKGGPAKEALKHEARRIKEGLSMHTIRRRLACIVLAVVTLVAGCSDELPKDRGVWYSCGMSVIEQIGGSDVDITGGAGHTVRVCGNPGLPDSDITEACIDQCEDDFSRFCFGSDELELDLSCSPDCAVIGGPLQTSEDCRNASIVPGPPTVAQAEVILDGDARASVSVDDESSGPVTPDGFLLYTAVACPAPPCAFMLADFRFTTPDFEIDDVPITGVLVQSAGLAEGTIDAAGNFELPPGRAKVSINFVVDGEHGSMTLTNSTPVRGHVNPIADIFTITGQFSQDDATVHLNLTGSHTNLPPVAAFQPTGTLECTSPQGAQVNFQSTSTDPDGAADITFLRWRVGTTPIGTGPQLPVTVPFGQTEVGLGVMDALFARDGEAQTLTVVDTTPPTVTAPADVTVECTSPQGASVELGTVTASDVCDSTLIVQNNAPAVFPLGMTTVTWHSTDDHSNTGSDTQQVKVNDTTAPALALSVTPSVLWAPNHELVTIRAGIVVSDTCDPSPTVRLVSVTSNESDNGTGDGNTTSDIQGATFGQDDREFQLRAERSGSGNDRVYTITYEATDASGNSTIRQATVAVPKSQK
jgi:hypothetical protein